MWLCRIIIIAVMLIYSLVNLEVNLEERILGDCMLLGFLVSILASVAVYIYSGDCILGLLAWVSIGLLFAWFDHNQA